MDKNTIKSGILLGLFITLIYIIYKSQHISPGVINNDSINNYTSEPTTYNKYEIAISSNDDKNIKNNKGFISEKINGVTFSEQMNEIDSYVKIFQDSYDINELLVTAKKVKSIDVHEYYIPYRDYVEQALEDKASKIKAEEYQNDIILWSNSKLVEFYDTMEKCFKTSGVEYTRSEDTHITYRYYYFMPN